MSIATEALRGDAGARLAKAAEDADLLVVGSHGKGRLYHAVLGSVAEECVRLARCPVVVIPVPHQLRTRAGALVTPGHQAGSLIDYDIHSERLAAHPTAVRRATLRLGQVGPWLADTYQQVAGRLERTGDRIDGPPFARYAIGVETMTVEAGFPVSAPVSSDDTVTRRPCLAARPRSRPMSARTTSSAMPIRPSASGWPNTVGYRSASTGRCIAPTRTSTPTQPSGARMSWCPARLPLAAGNQETRISTASDGPLTIYAALRWMRERRRRRSQLTVLRSALRARDFRPCRPARHG